MNNSNTSSPKNDINITNNDCDLYKVLELDQSASDLDIKKQFRKLALKYHPDKNNDRNACEKFNQIRIAYDILSDSNKKQKYDKMLQPKKKYFTDTIFLFLKQITNPKTIHNLMNNPEIINEISNGNVNVIAQKLIQKILNDIDIDIDIKELTNIFIHSPSVEKELNDTIKNNQQMQNKKNESISVESIEHSYETSDFNTLHIFGNIKTNLDDIYHNRLKEIIIKRKIYTTEKVITETNTYYVPLYDSKIEITDAGDKVIGNNNEVEVGNVFLKVYCKKDKTKTIIRNGYDIIYNDKITLYELFNGFTKEIEYFGSVLNISSLSPLTEYKFDGNKISIVISNKGLPYDQDGNRGNLIINNYLIKKNNFDELLKQHFN